MPPKDRRTFGKNLKASNESPIGVIGVSQRAPCVEGVPFLNYYQNAPNNFRQWAEALYIAAQVSLGPIAQICRDNVPYVVPPPMSIDEIMYGGVAAEDRTDEMDELMTGAEAREMLKVLRKEYVLKLDNYHEKECKLYSMIIGTMSNASLDKVKDTPDWNGIQYSCSVAKLWARIRVTHVSGITGLTFVDQAESQRNINRL